MPMGTAQANQQWMIQKNGAGYVSGSAVRAYYQFINASTGQCLTYAAVNETTAALNQLTVDNCDGTASQQFLVVRTMFSGVGGAPDTVSCALYGRHQPHIHDHVHAPRPRHAVRAAHRRHRGD